MNYSTFNQTYGSPNIKETFTTYDDIKESYRDKTNSFHKMPDFPLYEEDRSSSNHFDNGYEKAAMVTKGIMCEDDLDDVTTMFFSNENIRRIQRMIKTEISKRTKYKLEDDQDESDLLIAMRAVFFDANVGGRFLPSKIKRQVKNLNFQVIQYVVPDMIGNLKQQYKYLKEINQPLQPMMRPMCVSHSGRKTLPSIFTSFGL